MSAVVLGPEHWQAAKRRRGQREGDVARLALLSDPNRRLSLSEVMAGGPWWPPRNGGAA